MSLAGCDQEGAGRCGATAQSSRPSARRDARPTRVGDARDAPATRRNGVVYWTSGEWHEEGKEQSSNWREAANLVDRFTEEVESGTMDEEEVFLYTDNYVFESTYWKGSSSSKKLHALILRLGYDDLPPLASGRRTQVPFPGIMDVVRFGPTRWQAIGLGI